MKNLWLIAILLLIGLHFINSHWFVYTHTYNINYWDQEFSRSQTIIGDKAPRILADTELYPIIGYKYVTGLDPETLQAEVPPLGKQFFGLSILYFKNPLVIQLALGVLSVFMLYLLGFLLFQSPVPALIVVILQTLDPQFRLLLADAYLDIPALFFLLLSVYFFLRAEKDVRFFIPASFSLGLLMAVKFWLNGLLLLAVYLVYLFFRQNFRSFIAYIISLPFILVGFVIPYLPSLVRNPDPMAFLRLQSWMADWWAGNARAPWGGIFPIIFSGRWPTWWGRKELLRVREWTPLWFPALILSLISFIFSFQTRPEQSRRISNLKLKIINGPAVFVGMWALVYLSFLSLTSVFPRYLVLLTPFIYLLSVYFLKSLFYPNSRRSDPIS